MAAVTPVQMSPRRGRLAGCHFGEEATKSGAQNSCKLAPSGGFQSLGEVEMSADH